MRGKVEEGKGGSGGMGRRGRGYVGYGEYMGLRGGKKKRTYSPPGHPSRQISHSPSPFALRCCWICHHGLNISTLSP